VTVRIAFIGDTLLGGEAQPVLDRLGYPYALGGLAPLLADADLVVANHEGPLTTASRPAEKLDFGRKRYWYRGRPEAARALATVGVKVVSLANNHILDFGAEGLSDSIQALETAGIAHCGAGPDAAAARRAAVVTVGGVRLGFLSVMQRYEMYVQEGLYASATRPGPARLRISHLRADLAALNERVDLSVVLVHWGRNYRGLAARQQRLAGLLRDAGAGLIIGHHPHVAHPVRMLDGTPVAYSLGNAVLGTPGRFHSGRPPFGLVAMFELDGPRLVSCALRLLDVDNARVCFRPEPARGAEATAFLRALVDPCLPATDGPAGCVTIPCR
jgi:poly-gamma-glutamate synthesis protein (capsule biosynthesis protein)